MSDLGFIAFPAIVVLCYLVGATFKAINNDTLNKFIPMICGFVGGVLGIIVFKTIPGYIPADNWLMALAIGIVSGFLPPVSTRSISSLRRKSITRSTPTRKRLRHRQEPRRVIDGGRCYPCRQQDPELERLL